MPKHAIPTRIALGAVFGAAVAALGMLLFSGGRPAEKPDEPVFLPLPGASMVPATSGDCRACHPAEHDEWSRSRHALSWVNPQVEAYAALSLGLNDCVRCHAPSPVLRTGVGAEPVQRSEARESGVDCLTCHGSPAGIAGPRGNPLGQCRPTGDARLAESAMCSGCHRTIGLDWKESPAAKAGKQCQDCHMPPCTEGGRKGRRSHLMHGARNAFLLKGAISLEAYVSGGNLVVAVENTGAGHNFPGERHFRSLALSVLFLDASDDALKQQRVVIKQVSPIRQSPLNARIKAGAREEFRFEACEEAVIANVRLLYKFYPSDLDNEALVLKDVNVRLDR